MALWRQPYTVFAVARFEGADEAASLSRPVSTVQGLCPVSKTPAKPEFERLFLELGLPFSFLCDSGNPWGTTQSVGYTQFEARLMALGALTIHGRSCHPQTQGKTGRFHKKGEKHFA